MACDPNFGLVSLLLHCDGVSGATTFPDSSQNNFSMVDHGMPIVDTADPAYGTGAMYLGTGYGDVGVVTSIAAGGPLDMGAADFTVEGWLNPGITLPGYSALLATYTPPSGYGGITVFAGSGTTSLTALLKIGGTQYSATGPSTTTPAGTWASWAAVRKNTTLTVFLNGVPGTPVTIPAGAVQSDTIFAVGTQPQVGNHFPGQLDEIRVTKGLARYTTNYTPAGPFGGTCNTTVPNVVGQPLATAESNIVAASLVTGTVTTAYSLTVPGGYIISQSPLGGTPAAVGASVNLVESSGPGVGTVPDVLNLSQALAVAAIIAAGFTVGSITEQPDLIIIPGNVDAQTPAGGASAYLLSPVNITLSSGAETLLVPNLEGLTQAAAEALLVSLGLVVGAVSSAPSSLVESGLVMAQNPSAGNPVASGSLVSFVVSLGAPIPLQVFDFEATVISQYANSPTLLQLIGNMNQYIDQSANFTNFYNNVWNVDTAIGFGLDIWGRIVGVSRLLEIPNSTEYVGFYQHTESQPDQDWQTMATNQTSPPVGGAMYTGYNATEAYLLPDNAYRQLILAKAFANICETTAPAMNQILQNLYGEGQAWVLNGPGPMAISYNLAFTPTAIQLAILEQSGVIPTPPGVAVVINTDV